MTDGIGDVWLPVLIMFGLLALAYVAMWRGWMRRTRKHDLPPLVEVPAAPADKPLLQSEGRYFGSTVSGHWLDRVAARGLGTRSTCRLTLSEAGLDVQRPGASFRIPTGALRGARHDQGIAGKVVPPHGLLVITWAHGDLLLDSGVRLDDESVGALHDAWIASISTLAEENAA